MNAQSMGYLSIFGNILEAVGSVYSGYQNASVQKYQSKVSEAQAQLVEAQQRGQDELNAAGTKIKHDQAKKQMNNLQSEQVAAYASSGVTMSGSPIDVIVNSRANMELDLALSDINDSIINFSNASQSRLAAAGFRSEATINKAKGLSAISQGYGQASKSLLSAATTMYGNKSNILGKDTLGGANKN